MIKNERQYRIVRAQAEKFKMGLQQLIASQETEGTQNSTLRRSEIAGLQAHLSRLEADLLEYQELQTRRREPVLDVSAIEEIPIALIQARIYAGLTQRELAERLNIDEQQIQRYENTYYAHASVERITQIAQVLQFAAK